MSCGPPTRALPPGRRTPPPGPPRQMSPRQAARSIPPRRSRRGRPAARPHCRVCPTPSRCASCDPVPRAPDASRPAVGRLTLRPSGGSLGRAAGQRTRNKLARAAASHPWRTLALWEPPPSHAIAIIGVFLGSALTTEGEMTNDPESCRGYDLIEEHFPFDPAEIVNEVVIVRSESLTVEGPAFRQHVEQRSTKPSRRAEIWETAAPSTELRGRRDQGSGRFDENGLGARSIRPWRSGPHSGSRTARSAGVVAWAPRRDRSGLVTIDP